MTKCRCGKPLYRGIGCIDHGEAREEPTVEPLLDDDESARVGRGYSAAEEAFVLEHLGDMSYVAIAAALGRTAKGIEALVRSRGWEKHYVRKGAEKPQRMFPGDTPADQVLAVVLMVRARKGWAVSLSDLSVVSGLSRRQVMQSLQRLERRGMVRRERRADGWWGHRPAVLTWAGPDIARANPALGLRSENSLHEVCGGA